MIALFDKNSSESNGLNDWSAQNKFDWHTIGILSHFIHIFCRVALLVMTCHTPQVLANDIDTLSDLESVAQADIEQTDTRQQDSQKQDNQTQDNQPEDIQQLNKPLQSTNHSNTNSSQTNNNAKAVLYQIITSEPYSEKIEVKKPKKEKSWLTRLFEEWWKNNKDDKKKKKKEKSDGIDLPVFSMVLKFLLIVALVVLIVYIIKHRHKFMSWVRDFSFNSSQSISVTDYQDAYLYQGWEKLPEHSKVPQIVAKLTEQGHYLSASSILYRGSLRWLNREHKLNIQPATTEMKCLQLMTDVSNINQNTPSEITVEQNTTNIEPKQQSQPAKISEQSKGFIDEIIQLWIKLAYANNQHHSDNSLAKFANSWLVTLPMSSHHRGNNDGL